MYIFVVINQASKRGEAMQFKSYVLSNILVRKIKQKGVNIAIACGATLLLCNVSYAKTQDLGAGGTDNWTATCSGWL